MTNTMYVYLTSTLIVSYNQLIGYDLVASKNSENLKLLSRNRLCDYPFKP